MLSQTDALGDTTSYGYDTVRVPERRPSTRTATRPSPGHDVRGNMVSQTTCQDQAANVCSTAYYSYYPDDTSSAAAPRTPATTCC